MAESQPEVIKTETFRFGLQMIALVEKLPNTISATSVSKRLIPSGISVEATDEEPTTAHSNSDFVCQMNTSLRESREMLFWRQVLEASKILPTTALSGSLKEADELRCILGATVSNARGKRQK